MNDEEAFQLTEEFYDSNAQAYVDNTIAMTDDEWLERFSDLLPAKSRVLDVGCAGGRDTAWFSDRGFKAVGIDISSRMIEIAVSANPGAEYRSMNVINLDFPDSTFDGVWCSCVLLHVPRHLLAKACDELARVTRHDGVIYVLVKDGDSEGIEEDERYGGARKFASYFRSTELVEALANSGFEVIDSLDMHRKVDDYRASDRLFFLARRSA